MWECPFLTPLTGPNSAQPAPGPPSASAGPLQLQEDQLYVMCVSPYPHYLKDRLTNPCLYWLGYVKQELFMIEESDGSSIITAAIAATTQHLTDRFRILRKTAYENAGPAHRLCPSLVQSNQSLMKADHTSAMVWCFKQFKQCHKHFADILVSFSLYIPCGSVLQELQHRAGVQGPTCWTWGMCCTPPTASRMVRAAGSCWPGCRSCARGAALTTPAAYLSLGSCPTKVTNAEAKP